MFYAYSFIYLFNCYLFGGSFSEEQYNVGKQNKQQTLSWKWSGRKRSSSVTRHTPEETANSAHLPQKISPEFQIEAIYVDRYVKEASKELALSCRLHAINLIKPASRVYHAPT